ncbi:hypothetical protein [Paenibacillus vulneris]|uniref:hypothetical protein n=1 Tax=Paenibacillus vulneris TaxID=1133364 RepID=UPI0031EDB503
MKTINDSRIQPHDWVEDRIVCSNAHHSRHLSSASFGGYHENHAITESAGTAVRKMGFGRAGERYGFIADAVISHDLQAGLLGLVLGFSIARSKNRIQAVSLFALALWAGIALLLYAIRFPLIGPSVAASFDITTAIYILLFCLLYSAIWTELSLRLLARLSKSVHGL